ncbi:MAG: 2-oxo acid dehydrogenase subunit E2 [Anaerolineaceae bacterium]|nr:2-oxo acid dehydrogenase subunit E2 [Anaerolineaceae bacterium]
MAVEFFVPKLGQTVEEVTLVKWLVEDGAKVSQGQEVMEVETDKAVFPVEANGKGYIHIGPYTEGQVLPVLTVVAIIGKEDEKFAVAGSTPPAEEAAPAVESSSVAAEAASAAPASADGDNKLFASPRARKLAAEKHVDLSQVTATGWGGERVAERDVLNFLSQAPKATPLAQRMAADAGVDLRTVAGTGPGGRIIKEDIAAAVASAKPTPGAAAVVSTPAPAAPLPAAEVTERIPLKGVRAIIADRMGASVHTTARVTLLMEVDATEFVTARERIKAKVSEEWGYTPGYNDLLAKIVAAALRKFPYMNARLAPDAIELLSQVNIGMAVDTERGLLVPVVRGADQKSLREFGAEFRTMVDRARKGRSLPDDLSGGTFTITNLGMFDVDAFTPVINLPEAAILGVGRIAPKVVPYKGEVAIRQMWTLSLVFDHRLVDGAPAARFLQYIKQLIEEPFLLIAG